MNKISVTCTEKGVLLNKPFNFDFPVDYTEYDQLSQAEFYDKIHNQDVIIISDLKVDARILDNNPNLKLLALCSTGYDHVDMKLMREKGIKVANIRGYAGDAVAEHAFMLMINLIKNFNTQHHAVQSKAWSNANCSFILAAPIRELKNKNLVIIGKGEIGSALAEKAHAFGMNVIFSERPDATQVREGYVSFMEGIQTADVLSLHCELNATTKNMINADVLKQMKPQSILINVGRGGLVHTQDLVDALNQGTIAGFGADVLDQEPPAEDHPLLTLDHPNTIITAHIGWASDEAQERLFDILERNVNLNMKGIDSNLV